MKCKQCPISQCDFLVSLSLQRLFVRRLSLCVKLWSHCPYKDSLCHLAVWCSGLSVLTKTVSILLCDALVSLSLQWLVHLTVWRSGLAVLTKILCVHLAVWCSGLAVLTMTLCVHLTVWRSGLAVLTKILCVHLAVWCSGLAVLTKILCRRLSLCVKLWSNCPSYLRVHNTGVDLE